MRESSLLNEDILKLINFEDEPSKKRKRSPSQKYSKRRIMKKLKTVVPTNKLELSSPSISLSNDNSRSPRLEKKNYILKADIPSIKFHTPSTNLNENPLLNYYKKQNISPVQGEGEGTTPSAEDSKADSPYLLTNFDSINFPLPEEKNNLTNSSSNNGGREEDFPCFFGNGNQNSLTNDLNLKPLSLGLNQNMSSFQNCASQNEFLPLYSFNKNQPHTNSSQGNPMEGSTTSNSKKEKKNLLQNDNNYLENQFTNGINNNQNINNNVTINNNYIQQYHFPSQNQEYFQPSVHISNRAQSPVKMSSYYPNSPIPMDNFGYNQNQYINQSIPNLNQMQKAIPPETPIPGIQTFGLSDEELIMKAREMASEQNGCRLIQKRIENKPELGNDIFDALEKDLLTLSCGSFGNYLLQKLLSVIDFERINRFVDIVSPFFVQVSVSSHGTRVIQKLLDIIQSDINLVNKITMAINNNLLEITMDANSNHIVQKYVTVVPFPLNAPIYENIMNNFLLISKDKYGCCMMQKCIECGTNEQQRRLIVLSLQNSPLLITDQYGNYVLQYVVKLENQECISTIINLILTNLQKYCCQKFSSNVIEKCIERACPDLQNLLINAIIQNEKLVSDLIVDLYGNYIIQKILLVAKGKAYHILLNQIANNAERIRRVSFGSKVLAKLTSLHKDLCFIMNGGNVGSVPMLQNYNFNGYNANNYNNMNQINIVGNLSNQNSISNSNNYSYLMGNSIGANSNPMLYGNNRGIPGNIKVQSNNSVNMNNIKMFKTSGN